MTINLKSFARRLRSKKRAFCKVFAVDWNNLAYWIGFEFFNWQRDRDVSAYGIDTEGSIPIYAICRKQSREQIYVVPLIQTAITFDAPFISLCEDIVFRSGYFSFEQTFKLLIVHFEPTPFEKNGFQHYRRLLDTDKKHAFATVTSTTPFPKPKKATSVLSIGMLKDDLYAKFFEHRDTKITLVDRKRCYICNAAERDAPFELCEKCDDRLKRQLKG